MTEDIFVVICDWGGGNALFWELFIFFLNLSGICCVMGGKNSNSVGHDYPKRKIALVTFRFLWNCEFILSFCAVFNHLHH